MALLVAWSLLGSAAWAQATVVQAPIGGQPLRLPGRVVCGPVAEGWTVGEDSRSVRPPRTGSGRVGQPVALQVAPAASGCTGTQETLTLVATGAFPEVEPASVVLAADEGRLELRGRGLAGAQVFWPGPTRDARLEHEVCLDAGPSESPQPCVLPVRRGVRADVSLSLLPAGARFGEGVLTFDASGRQLAPSELQLRPSRVVLSSVLPAVPALDLSTGEGRLVLPHPEAIATVDCEPAYCEPSEDGVFVRAVPGLRTSLGLRVRLVPRVFVSRGEALESSASGVLQLLHCPVELVSGPPLRGAADVQVVVRMDPRCAKDARSFHWRANGEPAEVAQVVQEEAAAFVLLRVGRLGADRLTLTATRSEVDPTAIATTSVDTLAAPQPRASLELPGFGKIDFIPTNREAVLSVASPGERARLVPLPVEGAYSVRTEQGRFRVRGDENNSGFVPLRYGYRVEGVPQALRSVDLAIVNERTQRALREASVPAPLGASALSEEPLIEFLCADREGRPLRLQPGTPARIPFDSRDSCRIIIHRERLRPEDGLQEIILEVDVTSASGAPREAARVNERMVLQPGGEPRTLWLKNVLEQFDRIVVRVSHIVDESRYLLAAPSSRASLPSVQWAATLEGSRLRLYATATIPSGLYRLVQPTGQLTLNFGLLSRLTLLDEHGKEGLLGLEMGLMGVGLVQTGGLLNDYPPTLAAVAGLGIRVPLGSGPGGQAALSVHIWGAHEFREAYFTKPTDGSPGREVGRWALIFGPSISLGNIGMNL
ncbi:hypothetical protein [Archangium lansingense]|uniref:Uncharacterized protein n=1 Tax=Archangium lansingense TaxID=2995310 RepID=A0ABT4A5U2_9BACT|nr:hypothetical protein [Archangium lansinium]MCY1076342.1 hypothetical protein [Archangium lansinium]